MSALPKYEDHLFGPSVFKSDEQAIAECPRDIRVRAITGKTIVWFLPYRRTSGMMEIPEKHKEQGCEAIVIHDASENGLDPGVKVAVSRLAGTYFEIDEHRLCCVPGSAVILVDTKYSPEIE